MAVYKLEVSRTRWPVFCLLTPVFELAYCYLEVRAILIYTYRQHPAPSYAYGSELTIHRVAQSLTRVEDHGASEVREACCGGRCLPACVNSLSTVGIISHIIAGGYQNGFGDNTKRI